MAPNVASVSTRAMQSQARARRSRKDRPCDYCRRLKHTCRIAVRGDPCANCKKTARPCTFDGPPIIRHSRRDAEVDTPANRPKPAAPPSAPAPRESMSLVTLCSRVGPTDDASTELDTNTDTFYPSLEMDHNDLEESHYLDASAFAMLMHKNEFIPAGTYVSSVQDGQHLSYRQVSKSWPPAFFVRYPSKVYGPADQSSEAEAAYNAACQLLLEQDPTLAVKLLEIFIEQTLPALPIFNTHRLQTSCRKSSVHGGFPHSVVVGILAHTAVQVPTLRNHCKDLWRIVVNLLNNEYRSTRLQTLQLAILDIFGRPVLGSGGNHVAISRAIGIAQLLGLHRDSASWQLPKWEKGLRKRIWWSLVIADKWNAVAYGRPSNISSNTIPLPTLDDRDSSSDTAAFQAFVAMCKLTAILDDLLPLLSHHDISRAPNSQALLQNAAWKMEMELVDEFAHNNTDDGRSAPGQKSYELAKRGVKLLILGSTLDLQMSIDHKSGHVDLICEHILDAVKEITMFVGQLSEEDHISFWAPWSAVQLTLALPLLLRAAIRRPDCPSFLTTAVAHLDELIMAVRKAAEGGWEIGEDAFSRISLFMSSVPDLPGVESIKNKMASCAKAAGSSRASDNHFLSWLLEGTDGTSSDSDRVLGDISTWLGQWDWRQNFLADGSQQSGQQYPYEDAWR